MGTVYSTVKLLSAKKALQRPFAASVAVICARAFFVCQYSTEIMPTIIYWLIVASLHSTENHGYSLFHSKAVIGKRALQRPCVASLAVICAHVSFVYQYLTEIMPTIIYWLLVAFLHSTDIPGYSLFPSQAVIRKVSAPKAFCGVIGRHLRPCLLCLIIFNKNNANNHLLAYSSLPPLRGQSWVQFFPQ